MSRDSSESGTLTVAVIGGGVAITVLLLASGLAAFFVVGARPGPVRGKGFLVVLSQAIDGILCLSAHGLIEAGLLVLLLMPLARLVAGIVQSTRCGDWRFMIVGALVVVLLVTGIVLGTG